MAERTIASAHPREAAVRYRSTAAHYRSEKLFWPHYMSYRFYVAAAVWWRRDPGSTIDLACRTARSHGLTSQPLYVSRSVMERRTNAVERILIESHAPRRPFLLASVYVISHCTGTHAPQSVYFRSVDIRVLPDRHWRHGALCQSALCGEVGTCTVATKLLYTLGPVPTFELHR